jgi:hypothetical protein
MLGQSVSRWRQGGGHELEINAARFGFAEVSIPKMAIMIFT